MKLSMKQRILLRRLRKEKAKRQKEKEKPVAGVTVAHLTFNDRSEAEEILPETRSGSKQGRQDSLRPFASNFMHL